MADRKGEVSVLIKARDLASSVIGRFRRTLNGVTRVAKDVTRAIVGWTVAMAAAVIGLEKLTERGSKILAVKRTFAKLTDGETEALERLREASSDTIADFDLMALHNQALALGSAKTTAEFAEQIRVTRILGRAQGLEATEALEKFTVGMARMSKLRLDDLGITLTQTEADERYAAQLGRSSASLTENEKKIAFRNEAMRQANLLVEQLSAGEDAGAEAADRFGIAMANLRDKLATTAAESPTVTAFFDQLTGIASNLIDVIGGEADTLVDGMKAVGRIMGDAMSVGINEGLAAGFEKAGVFGALQRRFFESNAETARINLQANLDALDSIAAAARAEALARRATQDRLNREAGITPPGEGGGGPPPAPTITGAAGVFPGFTGTNEQLLALMDRIRETREGLRTAQLDRALATTEESAAKATEEVNKLQASLTSLEAKFQEFGIDPLAPLIGALQGPLPGAAVAPGRVPTLGAERVSLSRTGERLFEEQAEKRQKRLQEAEADINRAHAITAAAIGGTAQAVIAGSQSIASSITSMLTQILQASTMNPLTGAIIGSVGGLLGSFFRRRESKPTPVRVEDYGTRAVDQMRDIGGGPERVITIIEKGGVEIERIERELDDRQARDETIRFGAVSGMGS